MYLRESIHIATMLAAVVIASQKGPVLLVNRESRK